MSDIAANTSYGGESYIHLNNYDERSNCLRLAQSPVCKTKLADAEHEGVDVVYLMSMLMMMTVMMWR